MEHKHIKNRHDFLLEFIDNEPNGDVDVHVRDLRTKIDDFNSKKNKLAGILASIDPKNWEKKATEVIGGNEYLGIYWRLMKADNAVKLAADEVTGKEGSDLKMATDKLNLTKKELQLVKDELRNKQTDAKKQINDNK